MNIMVVLIGTGGHLIPLLSLIPGLEHEGFKISTISRMVGVEKRLVNSPDMIIKLFPFSGETIVVKVKSLITILLATIKVVTFIKRRSIRGIVTSGAFGSVPAILAAIYLRIPYFLIELNRIPGRVVRLFSKRSEVVFAAIPMLWKIKGNVLITGLPLREGFVDLERKGEFILIWGGSQGASFLNQLSLHLAKRLDQKIVLISGDRGYEWMKNQVSGVEVIPFTNEPWKYISKAELVIARAGASSTYELAVNRVPMILIPFPFATDRHQQANGEYYADLNGALIVEQDQPEAVADRIIKIIKSKEYKKLGMSSPPTDGRKRVIEEVKRRCWAR